MNLSMKEITLIKIFNMDFWKYIFNDKDADSEYGPLHKYFRLSWPWNDESITNYLAILINYFSRCLCRFNNHNCGVFYYNFGCEPDMTCKGCGEDLG